MSRTRRRRKKRSLNRNLALLLLLLTAATAYVGYHTIFQPLEQQAPSPALPEDGGPAEPASLTDPEEEIRRSHLERKPDFYTILVSGADDGNGNSDTNILVAVDTANGSIYGVSIPRDTKATINGKSRKINYAFGSGGMELLSQVVTEQLGIPVDYTVLVNLQGFVALVDAVGGVTFNVPIDMHYEDPYQDLYIHIPKGVQTLSGADALKVVRFREGYASQDIGRMETQQNFLKAVAKQLLKVDNLGKIDRFVKIFHTYVDTDLTLNNLAWLGKEAIGMGAEAVAFSTLPGEWHSPYIYLDQDAVLELINQHLNPYVEDRVPEDLHIPSRS
ncbi:MAG: LCP family protein [Oscillibacter sp.]|nr:LCP family protein [Oscillibacter sp.]